MVMTETNRCPRCGTELPEGARFCLQCGAPQTGAAVAHVTGSGAAAQGPQAAAAGAGGAVISGSVGGDVVTGDKSTTFEQREQQVEQQINVAGSFLGSIYRVYQAPLGRAALTEEDVRRILEEYLRWVRNSYSRARLYGLENSPMAHSQPRRRLQDVFVPLTLCRFQPPRQEELEALAGKRGDVEALSRAWVAWAGRQPESEVVPLSQLLTTSKRLAIVGGAGCGKSTLLAYLAVALSEAAQQEEAALPFDLPTVRGLPVPLIVPLRYYRDYLNLCDQSPQERLKHARARTLAGFIPWYLQRRSPALELSQDFFDRLLLGGGCLLMLDGLDEVVSRDERGQVRQEVEHLVNAVYPGNQVLVTAREAGYREEAVFGDDFTRLDVRGLDDEQIGALVRNWCQQLYPGEEDAQAEVLMEAIREINSLRVREDLPPLVSTPLMTTMVVSVKWGETELPRERAKLYEAGVRVILQAQYVPEEGTRDAARKEMVEWGGAWDTQRDWLSLLALAMHAGGRDGSAVRETRLRQILSPHVDPAALDRFVQAVRYRGGLLEERGEFFQFVHLTFQEFLAARLLAKRREDEEGWKQLLPRLTDPWWREVALLTYGFARADYAPAAQAYLNWLSGVEDGERRLAGLELAGAALLELEQPEPEQRRRQAERLVEGLRDEDIRAGGVLRARAGNVLAQLGDPRFRPDAWHLPAEPLLGFVEIPAGPFTMGSDKQRDAMAYDDELPQHEVTLPAYYVARYPVTVAQFRAFVKESGFRLRPGDEDCLRGVDTHPVMWVSWHEALAYCDWLTERLQAWEGTPEPLATLLREERWRVTLPSEAEWEKAARGTDGRIFPWGNDADPERANYSDTGIGATSAVGCFPGGASPYGVEDLSGNVWEWCRTKWEGSYQDYRGDDDLEGDALRVLRGCSFGYGARYVRAAYRDWDLPNFRVGRYPLPRVGYGGFRVVVVSPVSL